LDVAVSSPVARARRPVALVVAALIEALEALGLVALAALSIAAGPGSPYPTTAYGVGGTLLVSAVLLGAVAVNTLRLRPWARTAGIVWQLLQLLVGAYAFQGEGAQPASGAAAIAPAVVVVVLLLTRPVRDVLQRV
jgi:hypothetical protein